MKIIGMLPLVMLSFSISACTSEPTIRGQWDRRSAGTAQGACDDTGAPEDTVDVAIEDAGGVVAKASYGCKDGGFELSVPTGATGLHVIIHLLSDGPTHDPITLDVSGPVDHDVDLGKVQLVPTN